MEPTTEPTATGKKTDQTKLWLGLAGLTLSLCIFSLCLVSGSLILWQSLFNQAAAEDIAAGIELPGAQSNKPGQQTESPEPEQPAQPAATLPTGPGPTLSPQRTATFDTLPQIEPTPVTCPENSAVYLETAILTPTLGAISFATQQDSNGWPLDPALQFTSATTQVMATFGYVGMENGQTWERVWLFGDEELSRGGGVWDAGPGGKLTVQARLGEGGFAPGQYKLEIYVDGQLSSQGSFLVVSQNTPTERPVQVAYTTFNGNSRQLNLLNLESGETELLVEAAHSPAFSADAKGLLYYGDSDSAAESSGLWVFNTSQRQSYRLTEDIVYQAKSWSPQRTFVASTLNEEDGPRLILWDINEPQVVTGPPGAEPAWSPDGLRLAYRGCDDAGWHLGTMQVIGPHFYLDSRQRLTNGDDSQPAWSWDGQRLAFVRLAGGDRNIYTVRADGSDLTQLTNHPGPDSAPAWTPDGRLLFRSLRDGQWGLYSINADGSGERQLLATDSPPAWQPDRLAVSTDVLVSEPPPPKPQLQIPAGHGLLAVSNQANADEMTFTIDNIEHKIGPYQVRMLPLRPGSYTWTASWPAKVSRTGRAEIGLGQVAYPVVER